MNSTTTSVRCKRGKKHSRLLAPRVAGGSHSHEDCGKLAGGCMPRKLAAQEYLRDPEAWKRNHGYGYRWMAESGFSPLKRTFGEYVSAKSTKNMAQEMMIKTLPYNTFIGLTANL